MKAFADVLLRLGKRELFFLLSITRNYVVSVRRVFLSAELVYCPWTFHIIIFYLCCVLLIFRKRFHDAENGYDKN